MEPFQSSDYEIEIADENDGEENMKKCSKNSGHKNMWSIKEFTVNHLPEKWRHRNVIDKIVDVFQKTVKLKVSYVSPNRPDRYCNSIFRGLHVPFVGTGLAKIYTESLTSSPIECPLKNCPHASGYHEVTPMFDVFTANHVIFDNEEACRTIIEFFYDSPDRSTVVYAQVVEIESSNLELDTCNLRCVSHDLTLMQRLRSPPSFTETLFVPHPPQSDTRPKCLSQTEQDTLVVVISHPHGSFKRISLGEWVGYTDMPGNQDGKGETPMDLMKYVKANRPEWRVSGTYDDGVFLSANYLQFIEAKIQENQDISFVDIFRSKHDYTFLGMNSITYTAATCPGTSGARVNVFMEMCDSVEYAVNTEHSAYLEGKGNISGLATMEYEIQDNVKNYMKQIPRQSPAKKRVK